MWSRKSYNMMSSFPCVSVAMVALFLATGCTGGSVNLFDGKSLEGWSCDPVESASHWSVVQGELMGENEDMEPSILWTDASYSDFELDLDYIALTKDFDSGVFIRGESHQVQIGISRSLQKDMTGCIYAPVDEQGSYPGQTDKVEAFHQTAEWNPLKVIVSGRQIRTLLNGEPFVDYQAVHIPDEGPLGLQLHGGVHMGIKFRNIRLKPVNAE